MSNKHTKKRARNEKDDVLSVSPSSDTSEFSGFSSESDDDRTCAKRVRSKVVKVGNDTGHSVNSNTPQTGSSLIDLNNLSETNILQLRLVLGIGDGQSSNLNAVQWRNQSQFYTEAVLLGPYIFLGNQ